MNYNYEMNFNGIFCDVKWGKRHQLNFPRLIFRSIEHKKNYCLLNVSTMDWGDLIIKAPDFHFYGDKPKNGDKIQVYVEEDNSATMNACISITNDWR